MYVIAARTVVHYERSFVIPRVRAAFTTSGYYFDAEVAVSLASVEISPGRRARNRSREKERERERESRNSMNVALSLSLSLSLLYPQKSNDFCWRAREARENAT